MKYTKQDYEDILQVFLRALIRRVNKAFKAGRMSGEKAQFYECVLRQLTLDNLGAVDIAMIEDMPKQYEIALPFIHYKDTHLINLTELKHFYGEV